MATLSWGGLACGTIFFSLNMFNAKTYGETISIHGLVKQSSKKIKDKATGTGTDSYKTEIRNQDFFTIEVITS